MLACLSMLYAVTLQYTHQIASGMLWFICSQHVVYRRQLVSLLLHVYPLRILDCLRMILNCLHGNVVTKGVTIKLFLA